MVANADAINPTLAAGWLEYAQHAGFATDTARVRKPRDKPKVERAVQYVRGNFFAGEAFADLSDAQAKVVPWCTRTAGTRIHGTTAAQPGQVFTQDEKRCLLPVPAAYDVPTFTRVKVHGDFHVEVARALYSVPGAWLGQYLDARADQVLVKLFHQGKLVKTHPRQPPGGRVTEPADLPKEKARVRAAGPDQAHRRGRRPRQEHRDLRREAAGRPAALDQDACRVPALGPGPALRPRTGRGRLLDLPGPRRRLGHQDRLDAGHSNREEPPVLPAAADAPTGRFARDPGSSPWPGAPPSSPSSPAV